MTKKLVSDLCLFAAIALLIHSGVFGGIAWPVIGGNAPFKTYKLSVLIVEETSQRTTQLDAIFNAIQTATVAAGGRFQKLDKDQTDLSQDDQWVQDAWKAKGASVPWLVAADSRRGVSQALPTTSAADALKVLSPLGVK